MLMRARLACKCVCLRRAGPDRKTAGRPASAGRHFLSFWASPLKPMVPPRVAILMIHASSPAEKKRIPNS